MQYCTLLEKAQQWGLSKAIVRRYLQQGRIRGAVMKDGIWLIPAKAEKPRALNARPIEPTSPLARKILYQRSKNNHFGIYEYIQVNLAYSSCRMASNRLTLEQVMEIYRTGKVSIAFEPMKIDDVVEISNHFRACRYMIDTMMEELTGDYLRSLHAKLFRGTLADQEGRLHIGEYRNTPDKLGIAAASIPAQLTTLFTEYERKKEVLLYDTLDLHARFEAIHPFEDGNGRVGRLILVKECLRHGIDPFIIDDKHRSEYNRGIASWNSNPTALTAVVEQAQKRLQNQKATLDLMEYCRPATGRGAR